MCGIAGILSGPGGASIQQLKKMTDAIAHRGPEGDAHWTNNDNTIALGHRRLSIIDLSQAAAQPMHYLDRYTIIYNGEIYNYLELKEDLTKKGYKFRSQSDTEVILAAYACWKHDCLAMFDGMFAFVIWDEQEKSLFAARDRFGEKPFYYLHNKTANELWFASELKALYAAGLKRTPNEKLLLLFLSNGSAESAADPSLTFDEHVQQLPPASFMLFKQNQLTIRQYWQLEKDIEVLVDDETAIQDFANLFLSSVEKRFRSDVPVGTSLSGGLDSSSIVAAASGISAASNSYKCFSAIFPGFEKDESRFSQLVAAQYKLQQFTTASNAEDLAADLEKFIQQHDEPVGSASVYAQYKVYQLARQHGIKVLLDGQGADELLAGYTKYLHWYLQELVKKRPGSLRASMNQLKKNYANLKWGWKNYLAAWLPAEAAGRLQKRVMHRVMANEDIEPGFREANLDGSLVVKPVVTKLNDILHFNTRCGGLQELLRYADRNSMAHGCEVRLPFLWHKLAEFCFTLPASFKIRDGYTKWILRKSIDERLPAEIVWRKGKVGFEPPQRLWMENKQVQEMIQDAKGRLVKRGIIKPAVLNKKIQPQESHAADNTDWWYLSAGLLPG